MQFIGPVLTSGNMTIKVAINGYGTIGKRVADAVAAQDDMTVIGVTKTRPSFGCDLAVRKGYPPSAPSTMRTASELSPMQDMRVEAASPTCSHKPTSSSIARPEKPGQPTSSGTRLLA